MDCISAAGAALPPEGLHRITNAAGPKGSHHSPPAPLPIRWHLHPSTCSASPLSHHVPPPLPLTRPSPLILLSHPPAAPTCCSPVPPLWPVAASLPIDPLAMLTHRLPASSPLWGLPLQRACPCPGSWVALVPELRDARVYWPRLGLVGLPRHEGRGSTSEDSASHVHHDTPCGDRGTGPGRPRAGRPTSVTRHAGSSAPSPVRWVGSAIPSRGRCKAGPTPGSPSENPPGTELGAQ